MTHEACWHGSSGDGDSGYATIEYGGSTTSSCAAARSPGADVGGGEPRPGTNVGGRGVRSPQADVGGGEPGFSADMGGLIAVQVQMWDGWAQSRCRC